MEKEQLEPTSDGGASVCTAVPVCDRYPQAELKGEETETSIGWDLTNGPMENLELDEATD